MALWSPHLPANAAWQARSPAEAAGTGAVIARGRPGPAAQPARLAEPGDAAALRDDHRARRRADARQLPARRIRWAASQNVAGLLAEPGDLAVQHGDQR